MNNENDSIESSDEDVDNPKQLFELHVAEQDVSSGTIPISWCVEPKLIELAKKKGAKDPQVIIVVSPVSNYDLKKEVRYVVPLKDLMTYVEFKYAGLNRISAFVFFGRKKFGRDHYLFKWEGKYNSWVLDCEGEKFIDLNHPYLSSQINVVVPKECFAPEPPAWEKDWVNLFFREKVFDQCHFRKRRLFAYTLQPFVMLAIFLFRMVMWLVALLLLVKGAFKNYRVPFQILAYDTEQALKEVWSDGTYMIRADIPYHWSAGKYFLASVWPVFISPLFLFGYIVLYRAFSLTQIGFGALLALTVTVITDFIFSFLVEKKFVAKIIAKIRGPEKTAWYEDEEKQQLLLCNGDNKPLNINELPSKHRTFRLRFKAIKAMVCRPFSG